MQIVGFIGFKICLRVEVQIIVLKCKKSQVYINMRKIIRTKTNESPYFDKLITHDEMMAESSKY